MSTATKPETYKGIYAMHKYWGKKPFNVISDYIKKYSQAGDIVLDSFCGSGVTLAEALKLKRKAIGIDINPISIKLTQAALTKVDINKLKKEFEALKKELKPVIDSLYKTTCVECGSVAYQTHIIWTKGTPAEVWYRCEGCKARKIIRKGNGEDKAQAENPHLAPLWYPKTLMFENSRINVKKHQRVDELFTKRALVGLSYIIDRIKKIEDPAIRETLELTFTGALSQASKLVFVIRRRNKNSKRQSGEVGRAEVGSWVIGYWVPEEHFEINTWNCFENRFRKVLRGKEEVNQIFENPVEFYSNFETLRQSSGGAIVKKGSATDLDIPDDSIDYVFIDPPHDNRIPYLEMSLMWNAWLKLDDDCDWDREIVVSEARARNKDAQNYEHLMRKALGEIKRVLKPEGHFSLAFNSLNDEVWLSLLNMCVGAGFNIVDISPLEYSARSVVQDNRQNALKTDFVITCRKNNGHTINKIQMNNNEKELLNDIKDILCGKGLETYDIINKLFQKTIYQGFIYPPKKILATLEAKALYAHGKWHL